MDSDENEKSSFLSSGHSYNQRDRDRLSTFFEIPQAAKGRNEQIKTGTRKVKQHTGKLENCII